MAKITNEYYERQKALAEQAAFQREHWPAHELNTRVETVERESEIFRELKRLNDTVYTVSKRFEELEIRLAPVLTNVETANDSLVAAVPAPNTEIGQQIHTASDELISLWKQVEQVLARLGV